METINSIIINAWLKEQSQKPPGYDPGPLFRLSWSTDQYEMRSGTFSLYSNDVLIREIKGTRKIEKYPFLKDRWIFEQWYPPELCNCNELPVAIKEGSYEPLYVFEGLNGLPLPLNLNVIQFIVSRIQNKPKSSPSLIQSTIAEAMAEKEAKQFEIDMDYLDCSPIQSNLHFGEGILVPSNFHVQSPNLRNKDDSTL